MFIHMIGICGTGMGALAGLLEDAGHRVQGSDQSVYPPVSTMLATFQKRAGPTSARLAR